MIWLEYALLIGAGLLFQFSSDSVALGRVLTDTGATMTVGMLVIGGIVGIIGSVVHRYGLELSAYPMLVGVWTIYAIGVAARAVDGNAPMGFALLLGAGATGIAGRASELWHAIKVAEEFRERVNARLDATDFDTRLRDAEPPEHETRTHGED